eukprot:2148897-Lingulodinium_polyedra.AAC.1
MGARLGARRQPAAAEQDGAVAQRPPVRAPSAPHWHEDGSCSQLSPSGYVRRPRPTYEQGEVREEEEQQPRQSGSVTKERPRR